MELVKDSKSSKAPSPEATAQVMEVARERRVLIRRVACTAMLRIAPRLMITEDDASRIETWKWPSAATNGYRMER